MLLCFHICSTFPLVDEKYCIRPCSKSNNKDFCSSHSPDANLRESQGLAAQGTQVSDCVCALAHVHRSSRWEGSNIYYTSSGC